MENHQEKPSIEETQHKANVSDTARLFERSNNVPLNSKPPTFQNIKLNKVAHNFFEKDKTITTKETDSIPVNTIHQNNNTKSNDETDKPNENQQRLPPNEDVISHKEPDEINNDITTKDFIFNSNDAVSYTHLTLPTIYSV